MLIRYFSDLSEEYPNRINKNKDRFRVAYDLKNGYFIEVNQSAEPIKKFCIQIINRFELPEEDWKVEIIYNLSQVIHILQ